MVSGGIEGGRRLIGCLDLVFLPLLLLLLRPPPPKKAQLSDLVRGASCKTQPS